MAAFDALSFIIFKEKLLHIPGLAILHIGDMKELVEHSS
jgi:hypothetical protein